MKSLLKTIAAVLFVLAFIASCTKVDEPNNGGNNNSGNSGGNNNGGGNNETPTHEYVDLGLPSGTLWATCNVGANKPEEVGSLFAWGETSPKDSYHWSNYKYCYGTKNSLTKYCTDSSYGENGFTDFKTILEPSDDAARANLGVEWRIPTHNEWYELIQNTTKTLTSQNGVSGYRYTSANGESLFIPWTDGYWANDLYSMNMPSYAWYFDCSDISGCHRSLGCCVRPVKIR